MSKYIVNTVTTEGVTTEAGSRSKKADAITVASTVRDEQKLAVQVVTEAGTVVFEQAAPRKIKMSPKFTRVVELPEGVTAPEGLRVAYIRPRAGFAVLCDDALRLAKKEAEGDSGDDIKPYTLLNLKTNKVSKGAFPTTRDAGASMTSRYAVVKAAKAVTPEPEPAAPAAPEAESELANA